LRITANFWQGASPQIRHESGLPGDVQTFASGEAKVCHQVANKTLAKPVIIPL
jgi:hypothetical protein